MKSFVLLISFVLMQFNYAEATYYDSVNFVIDMNSYKTTEDWLNFPLQDSDYWNSPVFSGNSNIAWKSGSMTYNRFEFYGNSNFNFSGGSIDNAIMGISDTSEAYLNGGTVGFAITVEDQGLLEINSGYIRIAQAQDNGHITYKGGKVDLGINLRGNATLDIWGFNLNYSFLQHSSLWGRDEYLLTGLLNDGSQMSTFLNIYDGYTGNVNLMSVPDAVPEPSSLIFLATGGILIIGMHLIRTKRESKVV